MAAEEVTNPSFNSSRVVPQQYMLAGGDTLLHAEATAIWEQALAKARGHLSNLLSDPNRHALFADVFGRAATDPATFNGIKSHAKSDLLGINLDIDSAIGRFVFGNPDFFSWEYNLYESQYVNVGVSLDFLDLGIEEKVSLSQDITTTVDPITGMLTIDNGAPISYRIGEPITLPLSTFDVNNDGKLDLSFNYDKTATVKNKTDLLLDTVAHMSILDGSAYAGIDMPWPLKDYGIEYGVGPLFEKEYTVLSIPFNLYQDSWTVQLATASNQQLSVG